MNRMKRALIIIGDATEMRGTVAWAGVRRWTDPHRASPIGETHPNEESWFDPLSGECFLG